MKDKKKSIYRDLFTVVRGETHIIYDFMTYSSNIVEDFKKCQALSWVLRS